MCLSLMNGQYIEYKNNKLTYNLSNNRKPQEYPPDRINVYRVESLDKRYYSKVCNVHHNMSDDHIFEKMPNLKKLYLPWPYSFSSDNPVSIEALYLHGRGVFFKNLHAPNLRKLYIRKYCDVDDENIDAVIHVEHLEIGDCYYTNKFAEKLAQFTALRVLRLNKLILSNSCDILQNMQNLRELKLESCSGIKNCAFQNLPHLYKLTIYANYNITDDIFDCMPNLRVLSLKRCNKIRGAKFPKNISDLALNNMPRITDSAIYTLRDLDNLTLIDCPQLSNDAVNKLRFALNFHKIKNCPRITCMDDEFSFYKGFI